MWDFISPVNLIRYLIIWRVNSPQVQLPRCLSTELSQVLGAIIANRLPTRQAHAWRKAPGWPIHAVLFPYPGKRVNGQGEVILWELKLLGASTDHGVFLEVILPAMEAAATGNFGSGAPPSYSSSPKSKIQDSKSYSLWGHFDIQSVYAARGAHWEPVVIDGRLDLSYRASPAQWAEGLTFDLDGSSVQSPSQQKRRYQHLTWITPFDLAPPDKVTSKDPVTLSPPHLVTLSSILDALMDRMTLFLPGKNRTVKDTWALLSTEDQMAISLALEQAKLSSQQRQTLQPAPKEWPGRWIGTQTFKALPAQLLPYLELASILHIGKQTHFGCGTFMLT